MYSEYYSNDEDVESGYESPSNMTEGLYSTLCHKRGRSFGVAAPGPDYWQSSKSCQIPSHYVLAPNRVQPPPSFYRSFFRDEDDENGCSSRDSDLDKEFDNSKAIPTNYRLVPCPDQPQTSSTIYLEDEYEESISVSKAFYERPEMTVSGPVQMPTVRPCYYDFKRFRHFHYISKLARNCRLRVEKLTRNKIPELELSNDAIVKITYAGELTEENLRLVSDIKGQEDVPMDTSIWEPSLIVFFENKYSQLESVSELLCTKEASHLILVTSKSVSENSFFNNRKIVMTDKDHVQETITSCLEEPIGILLDKWTTELKTCNVTKQIERTITEIENIRNQMSFRNTKAKSTSYSQNLWYANIVPRNVKEHLFRKSYVNSFGLWRNSQFKVFVEENTDVQKLHNELTSLRKSETFFAKYTLKIEKRKPMEKLNMKQGDGISSNPSTEDFEVGTLGGFVTKTDDPERKYALTCNHIFPIQNLSAYANLDGSGQFQNIGRCVFTTRQQHCDFAVIEINELVSDNCDVTFRNDESEETNAHVYGDRIDNLNIVHKIGAESDITTGIIESSEFYINNLTDGDNRDFVFLVRGTDGIFSKEGDSGSLVFSRPLQVEQTHVNVAGMVYGVVNDIDGTGVGDDVSSCYRIQPALRLFQENQGFNVKFKDHY